METFRKFGVKIPIFLFISMVLSGLAFGAETALCGKYFIEGEEAPAFTKNERILICGDETTKEWSQISDSQSLFHIKTFLQQRGYFNVESEKQGANTLVRIGARQKVTSWKVKGLPIGLDPNTYRRIKNEYLTPELLDKISYRLIKDIERWGNACSKVKTEALAPTGEVWTDVKVGDRQILYSLSEEPVEGLSENVLRRYDAFRIGETYNGDLLSLTENRVMAENILQNTHFNFSCDPKGVKVVQKNVAGPPRLFTFGIGVNTEKGPISKAAWKHVRLGTLGSNTELSLVSSLKTQEFNSTTDYYFSSSLQRFHFRPVVSVKHENEKNFERYQGELKLTPATSWDNQTVGLKALFGPSLHLVKTLRGEGPNDAKFLAFNSSLIVMDHVFELFRNTPKEGFEIQMGDLSTIEGVLSPVTAHKFDLKVTRLWNLFHLSPPFCVIGIRGAYAFTLTRETPGSLSRLPSNFLHFLGGSSDLRGFSRLELPGPEGALSTAFIGLEIRFPDLFPWNLQPIAFADAGMVGIKSFSLEPRLYGSPGGGIRWDSPIGVFRSTLANGLIFDEGRSVYSQWKLYLSYGEEF